MTTPLDPRDPNRPPQPLAYRTPEPPRDTGELDAMDWVLAVLCSGIGCIIGIVRTIQGKKSGPKLLGISLLFIVLWTLVRIAITVAMQHP